MTSAFIVHANVDSIDQASLLRIADEIHDALEAKGVSIESVAPWVRPSLNQPSLTPGAVGSIPPSQPPASPPSLF